MKLTDSAKFWLVFLFVLFAALLGGILGNWAFIYLLDKYYGVPSGNYLSSSTPSAVIVRDNKKTIVEQDSRIAQAVALADRGLVKIFKKQANGIYQPKDALATAVVMTSDGWLMTLNDITPAKAGSYSEYEVVTSDRKIFSIESIKTDVISKVSYIHLTEAKNLLVSNLVSSQELSVGQTLIAIDFDGSVEIGRLSRDASTTFSSDVLFTKLVVSDFSGHNAYLFDANGQMVGAIYNGQVLAMNGIGKTLEKLLTEGKIVYSRLGVNYLDFSRVFDREGRTGALVVSLVKDSPAEKGGLKVNDVITTLDGTAINEFNNFTLLMQDYSPNDTVALTIRRAKETKNISIKLDELIVK